MMKAPCLKCENRHYGCHASCEEYQKFFKEKQEINAEMLRQKEEERWIMKHVKQRQRGK